MPERLNIMLSSTQEDLLAHIAKAKVAIEQYGGFPLVMENMPASPYDAITASLKMVDQADIYIGIFACRYGYVPDDPRNPKKLSITELEYRYATVRGIPCLIFLMSDDHPIPARMVEEGMGAKKLRKLKEAVKQTHVVAFFTSPEDLAAKVLHALQSLPRETESTFEEKPSDLPPELSPVSEGDTKDSGNSGRGDDSQDPPGQIGSSDGKVPDMPQTRRLEAAMPRETRIGRGEETELWVKISMPNSEGLVDELPAFVPSGDVIQKSDIRRTKFPIPFPIHRLRSANLYVEVESDDFDVWPSSKKIRLVPDTDSATMVFRLKPKSKSEKRARVLITLFYQKLPIAQTSVSTALVKAIQENAWNLQLAAVPNISVGSSGDLILEKPSIVKPQLQENPGKRPRKKELHLPTLTAARATIIAALITSLFGLFSTDMGQDFLGFDDKPTPASTRSAIDTPTPTDTPSISTSTPGNTLLNIFEDFEKCAQSPTWYLDQTVGHAGIAPVACSKGKGYQGTHALELSTAFRGGSGEEAVGVFYLVPGQTGSTMDWSGKMGLALQLHSPVGTPSTCYAQFYVKFITEVGYVWANGADNPLVSDAWTEIRVDFDNMVDENKRPIEPDLAKINQVGLKIYCKSSTPPFSGVFYVDSVRFE